MTESEREGRDERPEALGRRRRVRRRWAQKRRDERGLTLVELMIVVTIIAIIGAVSLAVYQDIVKKAKLAADHDVVSSLRSAVAIYYGRTNGLFPGSLGSVETLVQPAPIYNCSITPSYNKNNGKITFTATLDDCP
jgi:prepilin-type N-terminal cleavage/methylation domain-containing protein